jgi:hypothetical protein
LWDTKGPDLDFFMGKRFYDTKLVVKFWNEKNYFFTDTQTSPNYFLEARPALGQTTMHDRVDLTGIAQGQISLC